jgi:hypothetical protein
MTEMERLVFMFVFFDVKNEFENFWQLFIAVHSRGFIALQNFQGILYYAYCQHAPQNYKGKKIKIKQII